MNEETTTDTGLREIDPAALPVAEGDEPWTRAEVDEVVAELQEHAATLRARIEAQEAELAGLFADAGDGAGPDAADLGASTFERDHELSLVSTERTALEQVERALARIGEGRLGVCASCGGPIGKMRVMAFPRATLCVSCKQREERR
ncbi:MULTISPECIES: TraR/DksA family transcriptional regulator [unclassified Nocardioides]|uniref:TraR/DksA family transcriptional regulator n=1 Tax=unclassified Nocardioides TaxID=2615069 RepID=UPI00240575B3|nr:MULTISPECIES: TraR/DksA family transcriptional regulator [unclassified Nocardioides]